MRFGFELNSHFTVSLTHLTGQANHTGEVDTLEGAIQNANGHDEGNGIAFDGTGRPYDRGHQECDKRPAEGRAQDDPLAAEAVAEVAAHHLRQGVAPEERAEHGAGVGLAPLLGGGDSRHQQRHRCAGGVQHAGARYQGDEPHALLVPAKKRNLQ